MLQTTAAVGSDHDQIHPKFAGNSHDIPIRQTASDFDLIMHRVIKCFSSTYLKRGPSVLLPSWIRAEGDWNVHIRCRNLRDVQDVERGVAFFCQCAGQLNTGV